MIAVHTAFLQRFDVAPQGFSCPDYMIQQIRRGFSVLSRLSKTRIAWQRAEVRHADDGFVGAKKVSEPGHFLSVFSLVGTKHASRLPRVGKLNHQLFSDLFDLVHECPHSVHIHLVPDVAVALECGPVMQPSATASCC